MHNLPLDNTLQKLKSLNIINENKNLYSLNFNIERNKLLFSLISSEYNYFLWFIDFSESCRDTQPNVYTPDDVTLSP